MKYWYQKPHHQVSEYVRTVLLLEGFSQPDSHGLPLFTNGMSALLCRTEKVQQGNENIILLSLFGKSAPPHCWVINESTTLVAYFFKPFALASLFNIPASRLMKAPVELCHWSPHQARALNLQLTYSESTTRKVEILDNLLIHQLRQHKKECAIIKYATDKIMCDSVPQILSALQNELHINERTLQRIFKKYVGVTPNQYRRICQFQRSFAQLKAKTFDKLTDVAYDNGFADQSHFTRSFREFTTITPHTYLRSGLREKDP